MLLQDALVKLTLLRFDFCFESGEREGEGEGDIGFGGRNGVVREISKQSKTKNERRTPYFEEEREVVSKSQIHNKTSITPPPLLTGA